MYLSSPLVEETTTTVCTVTFMHALSLQGFFQGGSCTLAHSFPLPLQLTSCYTRLVSIALFASAPAPPPYPLKSRTNRFSLLRPSKSSSSPFASIVRAPSPHVCIYCRHDYEIELVFLHISKTYPPVLTLTKQMNNKLLAPD